MNFLDTICNILRRKCTKFHSLSLQRFPRTTSCISGDLLLLGGRRGEGKGGEGKAGEGEGKGGGGERRRRVGKGKRMEDIYILSESLFLALNYRLHSSS